VQFQWKIQMMNLERFIPLILATLGLAYASFKAKKNKGWLIIAFIVWLLAFFWAIGAFK